MFHEAAAPSFVDEELNIRGPKELHKGKALVSAYLVWEAQLGAFSLFRAAKSYLLTCVGILITAMKISCQPA